MHEEVWNKIVHKSYKKIPFLLFNYSARRLKNRDYPGLIEHHGAETEGIIYINVSEKDMERLNNFEGDEYQRIILKCQKHVKIKNIETYLYTGSKANILDENWSFDDFKHNSFNSFKNQFKGWKRY